MVAVQPQKTRRRGRPRKSESEGIQTEEIIDAAIELFRTQGYADTTMSDIAAAAGYGQSALYYWYRRKEEILEEVFRRTENSLRVAQEIVSAEESVYVKLYVVLYSDVYMLCTAPFDFFDLESAAHAQSEYLQSFFDTYRLLRKTIAQIISEGVEDGSFYEIDPSVAANCALAVGETLQHRYHMNETYPDSVLRMVGQTMYPSLSSKEALAHLSACSTLRSLVSHIDLDSIRKDALESGYLPS